MKLVTVTSNYADHNDGRFMLRASSDSEPFHIRFISRIQNIWIACEALRGVARRVWETSVHCAESWRFNCPLLACLLLAGLSHLYQAGEHPSLAVPVEVDLQKVCEQKV